MTDINYDLLSEKSLGDLIYIQKELNDCKNSLNLEKSKIYKTVNLIESKLKENSKNIKIVLDEIKRRESLEEAKNIISEDIKNIDNFSFLNEEELIIITKKMDKTDYRKYGNYPRWLDLEKIIKYVIGMKKYYPNWTLENMSKRGQIDTMPPESFYNYVFKDQYDNYFDIGGIKLISS